MLQDYESGKAIPNPQILGKLERILKVKLRGELVFKIAHTAVRPNITPGADIGKKMEGPKKT